MAHVLTAGEKTTQRKPGQWSKVYLAVPEYHTIYTARLNGVPASNDMVAEIDVDTETGIRANVLPDMTLYISATGFGQFDLGMCRIRKSPIAGKFYIGETSDVVWQDEAFLTIVDDYSLWQKSIRLIGETPYMDWDVAYSDQHSSFDPVPMMGTHHVAKLTGASVTVQLGPSADTSAWVIESTIASRTWSITGATLDNAAAVNPIATFTAPGTYLAYCLFTAASGKTFTGVRYVIIWNDAHPLIEQFILSNGRGSFEGGYSFDVTLLSNTASLRNRSLVILCTEDYAENTSVIMPGQIEGAENILCIGWISDINNDRNSRFGEISFTVQSAEYWLRQIRDYPSGLELQTDVVGAWTKMPGLTTDRALWHFLHWRSTATRVLDFIPTGDMRFSSRFNIARANLWERLVQVSAPTIYAAPHVDNFGRLFAFIEPQMVPEADRTWPVVMDILDADIEGGISWVRRDVTPISMLFFSGIKVDGTASASSFFSMSPGHSYGHHGEEEFQENYLVSSQEDSNETCGLYYGWKNNPLDNIEFPFVHSMRVLGICPRQYFYFEISAEEDPRGIGFAGNLIPRDVSFSIDPKTGFISVSVVMEPESFPGPSIDGDIPTMENVDFSTPDSSTDFTVPELPEIPLVTFPPSVENPNHPKKVVITSFQGIFYTETFDATSPMWKAMNNGLNDTDRADILKFIRTPSGALYLLTGGGEIFRATGVGSAWTKIAVSGDFDYGIISIAPISIRNDRVLIVGRAYFYPGPGTILGDTRLIVDGAMGGSAGTTIIQGTGDAVYSNGKIYCFGDLAAFFSTPYVEVYDAGGIPGYNGSINTAVGQDAAARYATVAGTGGLILQWDSASPGGYNIITNKGTVVNRYTSISPATNYQGLSLSPAGYGMGATRYPHTPYKTTDGGYTWNLVSGTIPAGSDIWENCGDNNRWIFGGGTTIRLTLDQGNTYVDKTGNLGYIAPLLDITGIKYIE